MPRKPTKGVAPASPGTVLRLHRESQGWSQAELAERLGYSKAMISAVERGEKHPTLDWWYSAATAIGLDPSTLDKRLASTA